MSEALISRADAEDLNAASRGPQIRRDAAAATGNSRSEWTFESGKGKMETYDSVPDCNEKCCKSEDDSSPLNVFECNVCFEIANEPVVTVCGHLYCWPCLYRWLQQGSHQCPVCKGVVNDEDKIIPVYCRGGADKEDIRRKLKLEAPVPSRPTSRRVALEPGTDLAGGELMSNAFVGRRALGNPTDVVPEILTPEQQQQVFLSRLLLMLGSFVILCLLLF